MNKLWVIVFVVFISACGTTGVKQEKYQIDLSQASYKLISASNKSKNIHSDYLLHVLESRLEQHLSAHKRFHEKKGELSVNIELIEHDMRSITAKDLLGFFSGTDHIQTIVSVSRGKEVIWRKQFSQSNIYPDGNVRDTYSIMGNDHALEVLPFLLGKQQ